MKIFVEGGARSGENVFKCLALGADSALIDRYYFIVALVAGKEGVKIYSEKIKSEIRNVIILTGSSELKDITSDKIIY